MAEGIEFKDWWPEITRLRNRVLQLEVVLRGIAIAQGVRKGTVAYEMQQAALQVLDGGAVNE